ncbi:Cytochrome P450 2A3 [Sciurus carolinensis]|uniref:Cytochrome P450 n=1 Tax=Sciurus carolinensis TaxID=30640 RepID=A0AA41MPS4_SCICA|nr:Cytochrome P450 2A3 [Sciurus carolinensis]
MLDSELILVALLACLSGMVLTSVWKQRSLQGKLPPGPTPLSFIGNFLQLEKNKIYNSLMKVPPGREVGGTGPVFTIHLGICWVVVCGCDAVKEMLVDQAEEFNGRGHQATFDHLFKGYGVAFSNGERTKQLKRFCLHVLRELGVGKRGTEHRIQQEADFLIEALQSTRGTFIDPTFHLSKMVANIMRSIVFGDRSDYDDKEFLSLLWMMGETLNIAASPMGQVSEIFHSVMKHLPGPQQQAFKNMQRPEDFTAKRVEQNQCTQLPINSLPTARHYWGKRSQPEVHNPCKRRIILTVLQEEPGAGCAGLLHFCFTESSRTMLFRLILVVKHPDVEGKQSCLGEGLATMELFLFLTTIMQNFCFKCSPEPQDIKLSQNPRVQSGSHQTSPRASCHAEPGLCQGRIWISFSLREKNNPNMNNLVMTTLSLFFVGADNTSRALNYGLLMLIKYPAVEVKVHEEIRQGPAWISRNQQPRFEDRNKMPYTEAVIHEIQRSGNFSPVDTDVFPMLGSLLNDPNCLGEGLARMELFLLFTTIMQNCLKSPQPPQDIDVKKIPEVFKAFTRQHPELPARRAMPLPWRGEGVGWCLGEEPGVGPTGGAGLRDWRRERRGCMDGEKENRLLPLLEINPSQLG